MNELLTRRMNPEHGAGMFLLTVSDTLRDGEPMEALQRVCDVMGKYFSCSRVGFGHLRADEDVFDYRACWTDGTVPPLAGEFPAHLFGVKIVEKLTAGQTVVVTDLFSDPLSDELRTRQTASEVDTRAILVVPFLWAGQLRTIVYLNNQSPRCWTAEEILLVEEVADRTRRVVELADTMSSLKAANKRLKIAVDAGRMAVWEIDLRSGNIFASPELNKVLGFPEGATPSAEEIRSRYCPGERERIEQHGRDVLARGERFIEAEYRYLWPTGEVRWLLQRCEVQFDQGAPVKAVGVVTDVTERRKWEGQREILVAELSHRVKNSLATALSIHRQSYLRAENSEQARTSFERRILALAQTHTRLAEDHWSGIPLATLILDELRPYHSDTGSNVRVRGPHVILPPNVALALGLGIHELATNAAKYGSLSVASGEVEVNWSNDSGSVEIIWQERGGPAVSAPTRSGFGRLLIERGLVSDLKGGVELHFHCDGVACRINFQLQDQRTLAEATPANYSATA